MNFLRVSAEKEAIPLPFCDWTIVPVGTEERHRVSWEFRCPEVSFKWSFEAKMKRDVNPQE